MLQVVVLLLAILAGSLPGLRLLAAPRPETCDCGMPTDSCPMKMPVRSPGSAPSSPCAPGAPAPVSLLTAPSQFAQAPERRLEPSPFPRGSVRPVAMMAAMLAAVPAVLPRPGPADPLPSSQRLAMLSVFRI